MSSDRELTHIVRSWLEEGVNVLPDRVLDEVLADLPVTPQRRRSWRAWRTHLMNSALKFAAAGAAALVLGIVAFALIFNRPAVGPASSPSPAQPPSVTVAVPTQPAVVEATPPSSPGVSATPAASADASAEATPTSASDAPFVAFLLNVPGTTPPDDLWAMRADGTGAQELLKGFGLPSLAWSQDGSRLLAVMEGGGGVARVLIAEVSGDVIGPFAETGFGTGADTACVAKSREPLPCQSSAFNLSPDGQRVVFVQSCTYIIPGCGFLTVLDLRTGELTELTATLAQGRDEGGPALPAFSPDGSTIAFTLENNPTPSGEGTLRESHLYLIDADGTNMREIDLPVSRVLAPQWSPDGSTIALMSDVWPTDGQNQQDVYTVRADGSGVGRLTTDGRSAWPEWISNGQIRFRVQNLTQTSTEFSVMNADGSNVTALVDLNPYFNAIDPPREAVKNITVPGDPGKTFFWQPID